MTTGEAFLLDICRHPQDDTTRLIYADYLDEHGQAERAEFIRLQCELAKYPPENSLSLGIYGPKRMQEGRRLRQRERELLTAWGERWVDAIAPAWRPGWSWRWQRGFGAAVRLTLADWYGAECGCFSKFRHLCLVCGGTGRKVAHGPALVQAAPLEVVTLSDREPADSGEGNEDIGGRWFWQASDTSTASRFLPFALAIYLPGSGYTSCNGGDLWSSYVVRYPSHAAALDALSTACLRWAQTSACGAPLPSA